MHVLYERLVRDSVVLQKTLKHFFKSKEDGDPFLRTVKLGIPGSLTYFDAKMKLDTGCEAHNLISLELIYELGLLGHVRVTEEAGCICLNGEELDFIGVITLQWKGKKFRKIFTTDFYVVGQDLLFWQVILGAETIHQHRILKFAGFGGWRPVLPKESKSKSLHFTATSLHFITTSPYHFITTSLHHDFTSSRLQFITTSLQYLITLQYSIILKQYPSLTNTTEEKESQKTHEENHTKQMKEEAAKVQADKKKKEETGRKGGHGSSSSSSSNSHRR
ncbi:hypothetical protein PVAG01_04379 [Phlyctema vagabunda]|uniref:Uncharacterized protein n=1 Tax=Phlyctema vagabunda TaxID=108571 RepID=A0ABR4PP46_9HELO